MGHDAKGTSPAPHLVSMQGLPSNGALWRKRAFLTKAANFQWRKKTGLCARGGKFSTVSVTSTCWSPMLPDHHHPQKDPVVHSRGNQTRSLRARSSQSLSGYWESSCWPFISAPKILIVGTSCPISFLVHKRVTSLLHHQRNRLFCPFVPHILLSALGRWIYTALPHGAWSPVY